MKEQFKKAPPTSPEEMLNWLDKESSISGTPHAQRSEALLKIKTKADRLPQWIKEIEEVLGTSVQSAVKREDEENLLISILKI